MKYPPPPPSTMSGSPPYSDWAQVAVQSLEPTLGIQDNYVALYFIRADSVEGVRQRRGGRMYKQAIPARYTEYDI